MSIFHTACFTTYLSRFCFISFAHLHLHANREQLEQSGLLPFEEMLQRFLGKEYKPMKFPQLMTDLQRSIYTAKRISISEGLKNSYFDLNELESQFLALIKQDT